ncbi:hypothetical protein PAXRUDRAFT_156934 [Paxillus rubicundulus Ve08.2h10]|uniref:DDE Tnp4 domain-containing protein n=1 Tax=Paxillus rubicundulus Ve08.2h10 TaxID=930991 RepID=A0A0D0CEF7_9AGAM|nr:hypothetical protein PAXRUDRAFT_156934 [Paxillus rubicundulus Ve08.2h10]
MHSSDPQHSCAHQCIRQQNAEELFNLCHAQAQNIIEWIFGVIKHFFCLMIACPEYSVATQAKLVPALAILHNFIHTLHHCLSADNIQHYQDTFTPLRGELEQDYEQVVPAHHGSDIGSIKAETAAARRDWIAEAMWASYQEVLAA